MHKNELAEGISNSPKTPAIKFRTFERYSKFLRNANFNPKFQTCTEFSGRYGNPNTNPVAVRGDFDNQGKLVWYPV